MAPNIGNDRAKPADDEKCSWFGELLDNRKNWGDSKRLQGMVRFTIAMAQKATDSGATAS